MILLCEVSALSLYFGPLLHLLFIMLLLSLLLLWDIRDEEALGLWLVGSSLLALMRVRDIIVDCAHLDYSQVQGVLLGG